MNIPEILPDLDYLDELSPEQLATVISHEICECDHYTPSLELIESCIMSGADLGCSDSEQWTPLHYAVNYDYIEIVKLLVAAGAPIDAQTSTLSTPLHRALMLRSGKDLTVEIVRILLNAGASKRITDKWGRTPWDIASDWIRERVPELKP